MKIGIVCYASVGGSGVVATELAASLAERGHEVHVLSSDVPFRLRQELRAVRVHRVDTPAYPLFREPQYVLSLSTGGRKLLQERGKLRTLLVAAIPGGQRAVGLPLESPAARRASRR